MRNKQTKFGMCVQGCLYNLLGKDMLDKRILPSDLEYKFGITYYEEVIMYTSVGYNLFPILTDYYSDIPDEHINDVVDVLKTQPNATYRVDVASNIKGLHAIMMIVNGSNLYIDDPNKPDYFHFSGRITDLYSVKTINLVTKQVNGVDMNVLPPYFRLKTTKYKNVVSVFKEEKRLKEEEEAKIKAFENMKGIRRKALFPYLNFIDDIDMMVSIEDEMVYLEEFNAVKNAKKRADEEAAKIKRFEELKKKRREDLIPYISFIDNFEAVVGIENEEEFENKLKEIKEAKRLHDEEVALEKQKKEEEEEALHQLLNSRVSELIDVFGFAKKGDYFYKDIYNLHITEIANISYADFKNKISQIFHNIEREEKLQQQEAAEAKTKAEEENRLRIEEENRQKELNKGDEDKVNDLINDLESLKTKYKFESTKSIKVYNYNGRLIYEVAL